MDKNNNYQGFLPPQGNFKNLKVYKYLRIIYDITYVFQERFLKIGDRTKDQMEQAARSGKQNVVEGSCAGRFSKHSEMLLTNVARSSLQELLEDYDDYLFSRDLQKWNVSDPRTQSSRDIIKNKINNYTLEVRKYFREVALTRSDETLANIAITMIYMADKMLYGLQQRQQKDFLTQGGIKERMFKARRNYESRSYNPKSPKSPKSPNTPNT